MPAPTSRPNVQIPSIPLVEYVLEQAEARADKPALVNAGTGHSLTYGELVQRVRRAATGLAANGFRKGDVLALFSPNLPEYAVAYYGAALLGGVVTTANPLHTASELRQQLKDSGASILITTRDLLPIALESALRTNVANVYAIGGSGALSFESLLHYGDRPPRVSIDPATDLVALPYSSGTTGQPKGVMLTHRNLVANLVQTAAAEGIGAAEVVIASLPFYHIYGMVVVMNMALRAGATVVTLPAFDPHTFLDAVQRYRVTTAYVVPPVIGMLARHPVVVEYDVSTLAHVVSGAGPLARDHAVGCAARIGCLVRQAYGMTETSSVTHMMPRDSPASDPESVGFPTPNTECRIVDVGTGQDVASATQLGEVWVKGPQVMHGYLNDPAATADMIDSAGWLHTGDIGYLDAQGRLFVLDRAKELVKFRGLQYDTKDLLLSMVEDLASRRQAADRLKCQAVLLDSVGESVIAADLDFLVMFWNKGAEALFGYSPAEALGQPLDALIVPSPEDRLAWRAEIAELRQTGRQTSQVNRRRKNGETIWVDLVASTVTGADGNASGFIAIHRDITERLRHQQALRESGVRLRNLASRLMEIREQERTALARELHDQLGQSLTRLQIDLCWLTAQLPKRLQTSRTRGMVALAGNVLETVQQISAELRPPILDDFGLDAAIDWQVREFSEWSRCRCELDLRLRSLPANRERDTAVFRIVQEALTNVARHSRADAVMVSGQLSGGDLIVRVADNGIGLAGEWVSSTGSLGLIGMRERAESVGGSVVFGSAADGGAVVCITIPVTRDKESDR